MEAIWKTPPTGSGATIYRGQADEWPLRPTLFRDESRTWKELKDRERTLLQLFKERCLYLLPSSPVGEYDMMSLAQHYGLPTRLLDWSGNPLMALFFAVETLAPKSPIVWMYDAPIVYVLLDRSPKTNVLYTGNPALLLRPMPHSHRVVIQAGWHTIHDSGMTEDRHFIQEPNLRVPAMENTNDAKLLTAIPVTPHKAIDIKKELRDMGIHAATVYGDLASVSREIQNDLGIPAYMRHGTEDL